MHNVPQKKVCTVITSVMMCLITSYIQAKPVNVGNGTPKDLDACSLGQVANLNPNGDGFLAVRNAPSTKSKMQYKIYNGQSVWMCDQSKNGKWIGVIYTKKGIDCGLEKRGNYKGRCYQGWVSAKYITVIAG